MDKEIKAHKKVTLPRYQQIAVDIAERIVENRYYVGQKLLARSTLASNFNVSPETARKAINVLVDLGIMEVQQGSGTYVASRENAQLFVEKYKDVQSIQETRREILESVDQQKEQLNHLSHLLENLVIQTKKVHDFSPFIPFELLLTEDAQLLDKSIAELNIWQKTGATIVGVQTANAMLLSPGPYTKLCQGDKLYFVGTELSVQRMRKLFYP